MLTPRRSLRAGRGGVPQTPAPCPCTPSPARHNRASQKGESTSHGCTPFQDHLVVLESFLHFRIILELEYAVGRRGFRRIPRIGAIRPAVRGALTLSKSLRKTRQME